MVTTKQNVYGLGTKLWDVVWWKISGIYTVTM